MDRPVAGLTSIVVVTHQSATTIASCLDSILASDSPVQVVVVDNASDDEAPRWVEQRADSDPRVTLIRNAGNPGFATACNQGAQWCHGDTLVFLNPDAFVERSSLRSLRNCFQADAAIGLLGCRVVDESGQPHGPQRRREPTWQRSFMSASGLSRWEQRWPRLEGVEVNAADVRPVSGDRERPVDADAVNGALMALPHAVFAAVGGFDEAFTLHAEDLDLCRRVRNACLSVAIAAHIRIVHVGGVSSRQRPFWVEWQKTRSLWRYFRKHEPQSNAGVRAVVATGLGLRLVAKLPRLAASALNRA